MYNHTKWQFSFQGFYKPRVFWQIRAWNNALCKGIQIGPFLWLKKHFVDELPPY